MYSMVCRLLSTTTLIALLALATPAAALTTEQVRYQADPVATGLMLNMAMEMAANGMTADDHIKGGPYECRRTTRTRGSCKLVVWSTAYPGSVCRATVVVSQRGRLLASHVTPAVCTYPSAS